jgi:hypothetical protein
METTRINVKLSKKQHEMLKALTESSGLNMTSWIQFQILTQYDRMNQQEKLPSTLQNLSKLVNDVKQINPEQLSMFNQLGDKG